VSALDLAAASLTLRVPEIVSGTLRVSDKACDGRVQGELITLACPSLAWIGSGRYPLTLVTRSGERTVQIGLMASMTRTDSAFRRDGQAPPTIRFEGSNPPAEVALLAGGVWYPAALGSDGALLLGATSRAPVEAALSRPDGEILVRARTDPRGAREWSWRLESGAPRSPSTVDDAFCPDADPRAGWRVLCVDATGAGHRLFWFADGVRSGILRPNRGLLVRVRHPAGDLVQVTGTGTRGTFEPGNLSRTNVQGGMLEGANPTAIISEILLAPRVPGELVVTVKGQRDGKTAWEQTVEMVVEKTWSGAVRVGLGLSWCPYRRDYEVTTVPGSSQAEVLDAMGGSHEPGVEFVVGYAPFLRRGGRGYAAPEDRRPLLDSLAPYVGFSLMSATQSQNPSFMKSAFVGAEWEFNPSSSLALALSFHQVEALREPYVVGSPVLPEKNVSYSAWRPGVTLLLNASPDLFKIATGAATP
jgi:hypothetical protein